MEKPNQPTSETINATQNISYRYDLLRALAEAVPNGTLKAWTDFDVDRVCFVLADILRDKGCTVCITSPNDIAAQVSFMQENEDNPILLDSKEAREACRWIEYNRHLNRLYEEIFTDACAEALRVKKDGAKMSKTEEAANE